MILVLEVLLVLVLVMDGVLDLILIYSLIRLNGLPDFVGESDPACWIMTTFEWLNTEKPS